jgi:hypothetical protein
MERTQPERMPLDICFDRKRAFPDLREGDHVFLRQCHPSEPDNDEGKTQKAQTRSSFHSDYPAKLGEPAVQSSLKH